tara:strand:- start:313 stop:486 length:174 start_codon:yes stop_codon:yes gene_type:complete
MYFTLFKKSIKNHQYYTDEEIKEIIDKQYELANFLFDIFIEDKKRKKFKKDNNCNEL